MVNEQDYLNTSTKKINLRSLFMYYRVKQN